MHLFDPFVPPAVPTTRPVPGTHRPARPHRSLGGEDGFSTAELLGNAALGIAALVAIWLVLEALGIRVVEWIGGQLGV